MKLKPWYDVVKPREDLREGKSQDASEFAVHLDRVRDGSARDDYRKPEQFFAKGRIHGHSDPCVEKDDSGSSASDHGADPAAFRQGK